MADALPQEEGTAAGSDLRRSSVRQVPGSRASRDRRFLVPRLAGAHIPRERLLRRLSEGSRHRLVLLSAPAGSGKTALLSSWAAAGQTPGPVAWLRVDHHHNDRSQFWSDVVTSLSGAMPPGSLDEISVPARGSSTRFLSTLNRRIAEVDNPVTLVVDDFQEIGRPSLLRDVGQFVRGAPSSLSVVISTRVDPDIGVERLRLDGECVDIRMADLTLTVSEAQRFMEGQRVELDDTHLRLLWEKTQGWIGALELAAVSLRTHADPEAFVNELAGSEAPVSDYLSKEVLAQQTPAARNFLLRVSVTKELSVDLANAITGLSNGRGILRSLARGNALVTAVDRGWYRIHPLFREMLFAELRYRFPREVEGLHRRAAVWLDENGHVRDAIEQAIAGRDWAFAGELLKRRWLRLLIDGQLSQLRTVVPAFPKVLFERDPELAIACSATYFESGDVTTSERYLRRAGDIAPEDFSSARLAVALPAARLYSSRLRGDFEGTAKAAQALLDDLSNGFESGSVDAGDLTALAWVNLGTAQVWAGQFVQAERHLQLALGRAAAGQLEYVSLTSEAYLSLLRVSQGQLKQARERAREALALAKDNGWRETAPAMVAFCVSALIHYQWGDQKAAERFVDPIALSQRSIRDQPLRALAGMARGLVLLRAGKFEGALDQFVGARQYIRQWPAFKQFDETLLSLEARAMDALGDRRRARDQLEDALRVSSSMEAATTLARLHLDAGEVDAALDLLKDATNDAAADQAVPSAGTYAKALEALARFNKGDRSGARDSCEAALNLAEPESVRMPFIEHGEIMRPVLEHQLETQTSHRGFIIELLDVLNEQHASQGSRLSLAEPLTEREQAVLNYLPSLLSYEEIAEDMFVSVNTLKTHVKSIYRKLSVSRRRDAVERAQDLDLIHSGSGSLH